MPEFLTSRRHLVTAGVGLAVVAALSGAATFAPGPAAAAPSVASAEAPTTVLIGAAPGSTGTAPTAAASATPGATVTAPSASPTPNGPAITALAERGIPIVALDAYKRAAALEAQEQPSCRLGWTLVAAIGAVESGHGTHAGARLYADGQDLPHVIGPVLDGTAGNARIADTDQGKLDGDRTYDRAVGPMQFIPTTWAAHGRDANGDGRADPFNIVDAAATTADYLCAGGGDLSTEAGRKAAVFSYNHLDSYVATVLALDAAYAGRPVVTTSTSPAPPPATPTTTAPRPSSPAPSTPRPSSSAPTPTPTPTRPSGPPTTPTPSPTCPTTTPTGSPTPTPSASPTPLPSGCPTPTGSSPTSSAPSTSPSAAPSASATPSASTSDADVAPTATPTPGG